MLSLSFSHSEALTDTCTHAHDRTGPKYMVVSAMFTKGTNREENQSPVFVDQLSRIIQEARDQDLVPAISFQRCVCVCLCVCVCVCVALAAADASFFGTLTCFCASMRHEATIVYAALSSWFLNP
jgi:hypothetical protein